MINMDWILKHKIIALIIALVFAVGAWYLLSGSSSSDAVLSAEQTAPAPAGTADLIESLLALRAVSLSGTIFSNPAFQALRDFSTPIVPEAIGRSDPFAPLGAANQASAASTQSAQIFAPRR